MEYDYRIILLTDAKNCLPPADGKTGKPKVSGTGRGLITPQALKYRIKARLVERGEKVLNFDHGEDYTVFKQINAYDKTVNLKEEAKKYLDIRLFGGMDLANKIGFAIEGPVSVEEAETVDPVILRQRVNSRTYKVDVNDDGSNAGSGYGNVTEIVEYGLYKTLIGIDMVRAKDMGTTDEDMEKLIDAVVHIWDHDYCALRPMGSMLVRKVIVWRMRKGEEKSIEKIKDSVKIRKKDGIEIPSNYEDYVIEITDPDSEIIY